MGLTGENGKDVGNYYSILGLSGDDGKENGNYYLGSHNVGCRRTLPRIEGAILGLYWGNLGIMEKKWKVL